MAALTELETATNRHFMPIITNQIFKVSPILYRIFRPSKEGSWGLALPSFNGREIVEPLEVADTTAGAGAYKAGDTPMWTPGTTDVLEGAHYPWRMYYAGVKILNRELEENKGRERIFDLAAVRLQNVTKVLRKALITDFYGMQVDGDGSDRMIGIGGICANNLIVGGIDQSGTAYWRGNGRQGPDATGGDLTWTLLNKIFYQTKMYGAGDRATVIVTTEGVLQNYENILTKVHALGGSQGDVGAIQLVAAARDQGKTIEGGFESFYFKRIPMVADQYLSNAGYLYFLNEKYLNWRVLKDFSTTGWMQMQGTGYDQVQNFIYGYGALTTSAPTKQAQMTGLTEA